MDSINGRIIKLKTKGLVRGYNINDCDASIYIYLETNADNPNLPIRQFISKTKTKIRYNIYIVNITKHDIENIKAVDNLPIGAVIQLVTVDGKNKTFNYDDTSINFEIPLIKPQLYSKIIIEIKNNIQNEKDNMMYIIEP
ncbi:MAG: hypothetical protein Q4B63_06380 [Clostridium perfringens]|nr:hypothetical protein [Clostridium perfringens]